MSRRPPEGMLLTTFLAKNYDWAQEPHLYCVMQDPQSLNKPAYRCGAAGTQLYKDNDLPYRSGTSQKGLQGRMQQYNGYWLPNVGKIYACLRTRAALVALPNQRTGGDEGAEYNIDRGNQTEVLARETHYHHFLDEIGLRWQKDRNNELFAPTRGPLQIVEQLRRVKGLQLLLFDANDWREDTLYTGGDAKEPTIVRETTQRIVPPRASTDQSLIVKMSKSGIDQLRAGNPNAYSRLMNLMRDAFKADNPGTSPNVGPDVRLPRATIDNLRATDPQRQARAVADVVDAVIPRQTRAQTRANQPVAMRTRARGVQQ